MPNAAFVGTPVLNQSNATTVLDTTGVLSTSASAILVHISWFNSAGTASGKPNLIEWNGVTVPVVDATNGFVDRSAYSSAYNMGTWVGILASAATGSHTLHVTFPNTVTVSLAFIGIQNYGSLTAVTK